MSTSLPDLAPGLPPARTATTATGPAPASSTALSTPPAPASVPAPEQSPALPTGEPRVAGSSEAHNRAGTSRRLNQLRAGVLGANDGIVSVAGLVVGVAAATPSFTALAVAGTAATLAGALSMAMGEYVSVSTQRDTEASLVSRLRRNLRSQPDREFEALVRSLGETGIPEDLAREAARRMTAHDPVDAHSRLRLGLDEVALVSPLGAAVASLVSFTLGALIPLLTVLLMPVAFTVPATFLAVVLALGLTGFLSARLGQAAAGRATARTILGGTIAMAVTYGIGALLGVSVL